MPHASSYDQGTVSKLSPCSNLPNPKGHGEVRNRTRVAGTGGASHANCARGPRKQHRNFNKTKTYITSTSLRQFCRAARRPVCFGRRSRSRSPSCGVTLHCGSFCLRRHPADRRAAATAANRIAYCDRQLRVRLRAKCTGGSGSAPVPGKKCRFQQLRFRLCILEEHSRMFNA